MKKTTTFLILLVLLMALSACSGNGEQTPAGGSTPGSGPATDTTALPAATTVLPQTGAGTPTAAPTQAAAAQADPTSAPTQAAESTPAAAATATLPPAPPAPLAAFPEGHNLSLEEVVGGFSSPLGLVPSPDDTGRLFVLQQGGQIYIVQNGQRLETPFLDISDRIGDSSGERGLLGLAFHPDFAHNGQFYLNYTDRNNNTAISRFSLSADPNQADPGSEVVLISQDQPYPNHNGGQLAFGPDGYLYIGLGDGGSQGDPHGNGQSTSTLLGKILRIDVNSGSPYGIPADNPFANGGGRPEVWAYGLRNPWRFSFDLQTSDLYIADVGQNTWEEIDFVPAGTPGGVAVPSNFGWDFFEGSHPYEGSPPQGVQITGPVFEYDHSQGCSVSGGYVYRGQSMPAWQGVYFLADFCSGRLWGLLHLPSGEWQGKLLLETGLTISSFGQDLSGEVYVVDYSGAIYHLVSED